MKIEFSDCQVSLWSGDNFTLSGTIKCHKSKISTLFGQNGAGKTIVLRALSTFFGSDASPVESVRGIFVNPRMDNEVGRVGYLHQNPLDNFDGGPIADNMRLAISQVHLDYDNQIKEIKELLTSIFDLDAQMIARPTNTLSHGEAQIVALIMHIVMKPQILFLDEPFSRLSRKNAEKILRLIYSHTTDMIKLASFHPDHFLDLLEEDTIDAFHVTRDYRKIDVLKSDAVHYGGFFTELIVMDQRIPINWDIYGQAQLTTKDFTNLPTNSIGLIPGSGAFVHKDASTITVGSGKSQIVEGNIHLTYGLNILYGDNGSGKTLISKSLAGDYNDRHGLRRFLSFSSMWASFSSAIYVFCPEDRKRRHLQQLRKDGLSYFLSSDPKQLIGTDRVIDEISITDIPPDIDLEAYLDLYGIRQDDFINRLSFGQQKFISFLGMPWHLEIAILDEPFANLSPEHSLLMAKFIINRISSGFWKCTVITSNRPDDTLRIFGSLFTPAVGREG